MPNITATMKKIGEFRKRVYTTSDKKRLKKGSKTYAYGTISIRDPKLTEHVGKKVLIRVYSLAKEEEG